MVGMKKKKKCRSNCMLSDLEKGDRFHFFKNKILYEFERYSEDEKGWIFFKDGHYKESIRKTDCGVKFLRNVKLNIK